MAVGALITGLQTMPSISWFPLAILLFGLNERAILFVVVLGAAPSIANGVITGIDNVPPSFLRLGTVLEPGRSPSTATSSFPPPCRVTSPAHAGLVVRVAQPHGR